MGKFTSFLIGGAVGGILGLLLAPRSGAETRAIVADRVDDYWGKSQDFYHQSVNRIQDSYSRVQPEVSKRGDELREKIDNARTIIADQVAKNARAARDAINDKIPVAAEKVSQVVDSARSQIDSAATALKDRAAEFSADRDAREDEAADSGVAAGGFGMRVPAPGVAGAVVADAVAETTDQPASSAPAQA